MAFLITLKTFWRPCMLSVKFNSTINKTTYCSTFWKTCFRSSWVHFESLIVLPLSVLFRTSWCTYIKRVNYLASGIAETLQVLDNNWPGRYSIYSATPSRNSLPDVLRPGASLSILHQKGNYYTKLLFELTRLINCKNALKSKSNWTS